MEFQVKNHGAELYSVIIDNVECVYGTNLKYGRNHRRIVSIYWDDKRYEI